MAEQREQKRLSSQQDQPESNEQPNEPTSYSEHSEHHNDGDEPIFTETQVLLKLEMNTRDDEEADDDDLVAKTPSSILIVGATGLVGLRFIKYIQRIAPEEQTIYVLARRHLFRPRPGVIVKVAEAATWPEEITKIPNLTTVYSALSPRPVNRFLHPEASPPEDEFYTIYHNLNYQIAVAAKEAGASTFVLASHWKVGYPFPKLLERRTKMRNALEKDLKGLGFDRLLIFRPGPLVGIREKTGTLKGFSLFSILQSLDTIFAEPVLLFNIYMPFTTFNFATSVAKAAAVNVYNDQTRDVEIYNPWWIIYGSAQYNYVNASRLMNKPWVQMKAMQNWADEFPKFELNSH